MIVWIPNPRQLDTLNNNGICPLNQQGQCQKP